MNDQRLEDNDMPTEIDFSKAIQGLHHIPAEVTVLLPAFIEQSVKALE